MKRKNYLEKLLVENINYRKALTITVAALFLFGLLIPMVNANSGTRVKQWFGQPKYNNNGKMYITLDTPIWIRAKDDTHWIKCIRYKIDNVDPTYTEKPTSNVHLFKISFILSTKGITTEGQHTLEYWAKAWAKAGEVQATTHKTRTFYVDITPPEIVSVQALVDNRVDIIFSEPIEKNSAETKSNYQINNDIQIYQATLDSNLFTVHLSTSKHQPGNYIIIVNGIKDRAVEPNLIKPYSYFAYRYIDLTPPAIDTVKALDDTLIAVSFSEPIDEESAEDHLNYKINKGIIIHSAELLPDEQTVHLLTSRHYQGIYQLMVNDIYDQADEPNKIADSTLVSYEYIDHKPPEIISVNALNPNQLKLVFNEPIEKKSAENVSNYHINNSIKVDSAYLADQDSIIFLFTSTHEEGEYIITIKGLKDQAKNPNVIADSITFTYQYIDLIPPEITNVKALDDTHLEITFSENIDETSALTIENYEIYQGNYSGLKLPKFMKKTGKEEEPLALSNKSNSKNLKINKNTSQSHLSAVAIISLTLKPDGKSVQMITSPHEEDTYTLIVNNIKDKALNANIIAPNTRYVYQYVDIIPPAIIDVQALNDTMVNVKFSELIDPRSAENVSNYRINKGIIIKKASLAFNQREVLLCTSQHVDGETYTITINNIKDQAASANMILPQSSMDYTYIYIDTEAPEVIDFELINAYRLQVCFNEMIDKTSAENIHNYSINHGITVKQALLDTSQKIINLMTSKHQRDIEYEVVLSNIYDCANPPNVLKEKRFLYKFDPASVNLLGEINRPNYENSYINVGGQCYVDQPSTITELPAHLGGCLLIKTALADSNNKKETFLSFELNDSAYVYIGYDAQAKSYPHWLADNFKKTSYSLEIDNSYQLNLWVREYGPGTVVLGGNKAAGAANVQLMYVVLIYNNNYRQPQKPDDMTDPFSEGPIEKYYLYQNFPNPFNSGTEIKFQLPEFSHIQLTIYNIRGQIVSTLMDSEKPAGYYTIKWDGKDKYGVQTYSGVYFVRLIATVQSKDNNTNKRKIIYNKVRKMVMIR